MKTIRTILSVPFYLISIPFSFIGWIWEEAGNNVRGEYDKD